VKSGRTKTSDDADDGAKKKKRSEIYEVAAKCEYVTKGMLSHCFLIAHLEACPKDFKGSLPHHIDTGG
jgi:hypothetical protein